MEEKTLYRHLFREAWQLTWKNKLLWVLGFLAVFWGGVGAYGSFNRALQDVGPQLTSKLPAQGPLLPPLAGVSAAGWIVFLLMIVLFVALTLAVIVLVTAARGGLIVAIVRRRENKTLRLSAVLKPGLRAFWPLLAIGILIRLDILLYLLALEPLARAPASAATLILYVLTFTLLTLVSIVLSLLGLYAAAAVMLDGLTLRQALVRSWEIFTQHWLVSLELALILYLLSFAVGIAAMLGLIALGVPFILGGAILAFTLGPGSGWFVWIPGIIVAIAFLLLAGAVFTTFLYGVWTLLYLRLRSQGAVAKVVRLTSRFAHILHRRIV